MRARLWIAPGCGMQSPADSAAHQLMPGRMKAHLVDAMAVAVVGAQLGRVAVGLLAPGDGLLGASDGADLAQALRRPARALARHALAQRGVLFEEVVVHQWRRLIEDVMCRVGVARRRVLRHTLAHMLRRAVPLGCRHRRTLLCPPGSLIAPAARNRLLLPVDARRYAPVNAGRVTIRAQRERGRLANGWTRVESACHTLIQRRVMAERWP